MTAVLLGFMAIVIFLSLRFIHIVASSEIASLLIIGTTLISLSILGRKII